MSSKVASCGRQTTFAFNHSIQVRSSFCLVVLVVLLHVRNYFVFVVIIILLPGLCGHLPVECGTEFFDELAFGCVEVSFVFCLHFSNLHHVPVVPPTIVADVRVHRVSVLFAVDVGTALFVLVLAFAKVGSRPHIDLFDRRVSAAQLVNDIVSTSKSESDTH